VAGLGTGCVNPQSDYENYISSAADAQGPPTSTGVVEAGPVDAANLHAPDSGFTDTQYVMACEVQLGNGAADAFLWVGTLTYSAKAGGGGTLILTDKPLLARATSINSVDPAGTPNSAGPATIAKDGTGTMMTGTQLVPGTSNPVSGAAAEIDSSFLQFHVEADDTVCANLGGNLVHPVTATLVPAENICIYRKPHSDGSFDALQDSDFHCP